MGLAFVAKTRPSKETSTRVKKEDRIDIKNVNPPPDGVGREAAISASVFSRHTM